MGCHLSNRMDPIKEAISVFEQKLLSERNWVLYDELFQLLKSSRPSVRRHFANYTPFQQLKFFKSRPTIFTVANGGYVWSNKTFGIDKSSATVVEAKKEEEEDMPREMYLKFCSAVTLLLKCYKSLNVLDLKRIVAYVFDDVAAALNKLPPVRQDELLRGVPDVTTAVSGGYSMLRLGGTREPDTSNLTRDEKFLLLAVSYMASFRDTYFQTLVEQVLELDPEEMKTFKGKSSQWLMSYVKKIELLDVEEDGFVSLFEEFYEGLVEFDCLPLATTTTITASGVAPKSEYKRFAESSAVECSRKVRKKSRSRDVCQHLRLRPASRKNIKDDDEEPDKLQAAAFYLLDVLPYMHPSEMAACISHVLEDVSSEGLAEELERRLKASPLTYSDKFGFVGLHSHYELPESILSTEEVFKLFVVGYLGVRGEAHFAVIEDEFRKTLPMELLVEMGPPSKLQKYKRFSKYFRVEEDGTVKFPETFVFPDKKTEVEKSVFESYNSPLNKTPSDDPDLPDDQESSSDTALRKHNNLAPVCRNVEDTFDQNIVHSISFLVSHFQVKSTPLLWRLFLHVFDTFRARFSTLYVEQQEEIVTKVYESFFIDQNGIASEKPDAKTEAYYLSDKTKQLLYFSYSLIDGGKMHYEKLFKEYEKHVTDVVPTVRSQSQKHRYFQRLAKVFSISESGYVELLPLPETDLCARFFEVHTFDETGILSTYLKAAKSPNRKPADPDKTNASKPKTKFKSKTSHPKIEETKSKSILLSSGVDVSSKWSLKFERDVFDKLGSVESQEMDVKPFKFGPSESDLSENKENTSDAQSEVVFAVHSEDNESIESQEMNAKPFKFGPPESDLSESKKHTSDAQFAVTLAVHSEDSKSIESQEMDAKLFKFGPPESDLSENKENTSDPQSAVTLAVHSEDNKSIRKVLEALKKNLGPQVNYLKEFEMSTAAVKSDLNYSTKDSDPTKSPRKFLKALRMNPDPKKIDLKVPEASKATVIQAKSDSHPYTQGSKGIESSRKILKAKKKYNEINKSDLKAFEVRTASTIEAKSDFSLCTPKGKSPPKVAKDFLKKVTEPNTSNIKISEMSIAATIQSKSNLNAPIQNLNNSGNVLTKKESSGVRNSVGESSTTEQNENSEKNIPCSVYENLEKEAVVICKVLNSKDKGDGPKPKNKLLEKKILDDEMSLKVAHSITYILSHFEAVDSIPQLFALILQIFSKIRTYFFALTLSDQVYFVRKCYLPFSIDSNGLLSLKRELEQELDLSEQEKQLLFFSYYLCRSGRTDFLKLFSDFSKQTRNPSKMTRNEKFCYFRKTANIFSVSNDGDVDLVPLPKLELGIVFFSNMYSDDSLPAVEIKKSRCRSKSSSKGTTRNRSASSSSSAAKDSGTGLEKSPTTDSSEPVARRSKSSEAKLETEIPHCASGNDDADGRASRRRKEDSSSKSVSSRHDSDRSRSPMLSSGSQEARSRSFCKKKSDRKPSHLRIRDAVCYLIQIFRVRSDSNFLDVVFHVLNENHRYLDMPCPDRLSLVRRCFVPFCMSEESVIQVHPLKVFAVEHLTDQEKDWLFIAHVLNDLGQVHFDVVFQKFEEHNRDVPSNLTTYSDRFYYFLLLDKLFDLKEDGRVKLPDIPKLDIDVTLLLFSFGPSTPDGFKKKDEVQPVNKASWYERSVSAEVSNTSRKLQSRNGSVSHTPDVFKKGSSNESKKSQSGSIIPLFTTESSDASRSSISSRSDAKKASIPSSAGQSNPSRFDSSGFSRGVSSAAALKIRFESESSEDEVRKINKIKRANIISAINSHLKKNGMSTLRDVKMDCNTRPIKDKEEPPKVIPIAKTGHQNLTGPSKTTSVKEEIKVKVQTEVEERTFPTLEPSSERASRLDDWQVVQKRTRRKSKSVAPEASQTRNPVARAKPVNEYDIHCQLRVKLNTAVDYLIRTLKVKISKNVVEVSFCAMPDIKELFLLLPNSTQTEVLKDVFRTFPENPNKTSSMKTPGLNRVSLSDDEKNSLLITYHLSTLGCVHYVKIFWWLRSYKTLPVRNETDSKAFRYFKDRDCFVIHSDGYVELSRFPPDELQYNHLFSVKREHEQSSRSLSRKPDEGRAGSGRSCSVSQNAKLPGSGLVVRVTGPRLKSIIVNNSQLDNRPVEKSQSDTHPKSIAVEESQPDTRPKSITVEKSGTDKREAVEESGNWSDEAYYTDLEHSDHLKDKICSRLTSGIRFLLNYHDSVSQLDAVRIVLYVLSDVRVAFAKFLKPEQREMLLKSFANFACIGDALYKKSSEKTAFDLSEEEKRMLLTVYLVYQNGVMRYEDVLHSFGVFGDARPRSWPDKETFVSERRNHLRLNQSGLLMLFPLPVVHLPTEANQSLPSRPPPGFGNGPLASEPPSNRTNPSARAEDSHDEEIFYDFEPHQDPAMELQAINFFTHILDIYKSGRSVNILQKYSASALSSVREYLIQCYDGDVRKFFDCHPGLFYVSPQGSVCLKNAGGSER